MASDMTATKLLAAQELNRQQVKEEVDQLVEDLLSYMVDDLMTKAEQAKAKKS